MDSSPRPCSPAGEDWLAAVGEPSARAAESLRGIVGYLNFSSGPAPAATLAAWNIVHTEATAGDPLSGPPPFLVMRIWVEQTIEQLQATSSAFADTDRARRLVPLLWSGLLPAYLDFHRDLLFHQPPEILFNGFMLGRCAEAILERLGDRGADAVDQSRLIAEVIADLNDYVGYRPVAVLENRKCTPYEHEFVRPIPVAMPGLGGVDVSVSAGPHADLIGRAIEAIRSAPQDILRAASLEPDQMIEVAIDPRAYDFDHPVNRRPNYHFGGWDERSIDLEGRYNRFVVRAVTLSALQSRLDESAGQNQAVDAELLEEAASVLAGTMLMASGISGWGPGAYSSDVTLRSLMAPIADYRDRFYRWRISQVSAAHSARLREEESVRHQPFGAARQHLNAALARRRAVQLQHVQLARLYARMGYPDAAKRQADVVPAASARLMCRIDCHLTLGLRELRAGRIEAAAQVPQQTFDLIRRAIDCGALIDPWNLLGFGGQFALYPGIENSIHDTRVDELLFLVDNLFGYIARVWSEAAARDHGELYESMESVYRRVAQWWHQFAAHTVSDIEATDPWDNFESARLVAQALRLWHRGGATRGDIAFWAPHADLFDSPRAYQLVLHALLERHDFVPAQALLIHWLGAAERIGIRAGGGTLPALAQRWLLQLRKSARGTEPQQPLWPRIRKFFDYLEANAESYWNTPHFEVGGDAQPRRPIDDLEDELADARDDGGQNDGGQGDGGQNDGGLLDPDARETHDDLYAAAYDEMTYRDTTDDGNEGSVFEFADEGSADALEAEVRRLGDRLEFLQSLSRMWAVAADVAVTDRAVAGEVDLDDSHGRVEALRGWAARAVQNRTGLLKLLDSVRGYKVSPSGTDKDSMRTYDRRRVLRDSLMERIINTAVEMSDARRLIAAAAGALDNDVAATPRDELAEDDDGAIELFAALMAGEEEHARGRFDKFLNSAMKRNLLYIPLSRGGDPVKIYVTRLRQRHLSHLLHWMPRCGLVTQTCRLVEAARQMEQRNPIGIGAVTEFDGLYKTGFRSMVHSVATAVIADAGGDADKIDQEAIAARLVPMLEKLTETTLGSWLAHSQTLRLSPLESVTDRGRWKRLVEFIETYGDPLFTQGFLQLSNVRGVLHQGVAGWLRRVVEDADPLIADTKLGEDLEAGVISIDEAAGHLSLVFESLLDHHAEYQDYNSTTTQSDRGELIYTFLDFLRLRSRYERVAWNLRPVMWTHQVLVSMGLLATAAAWRANLVQRIAGEAELYVTKLRELQAKYSMRMPTIADRINERFVQPMTIDRMRALVSPAMQDAEIDRRSVAFETLQTEADRLAQNPVGVGLDLPPWIGALEDEVNRYTRSGIDPKSLVTIKIRPMPIAELQTQLRLAATQGRRLPNLRRRSE